jgi:predicted small metal-binding protein
MVQTVLPCDCGFEARAENEQGLLAEIQRHAREVHGMQLSRDDALLIASRAQAAEDAPHTQKEDR